MGKQKQPVAVCTNCGDVVYKANGIHNDCGRTLADGKRCKGTIQSALQETDWLECPYCDGTGSTGAKCEPCGGVGWQFVRDKPWLKKEIEEERQKRGK